MYDEAKHRSLLRAKLNILDAIGSLEDAASVPTMSSEAQDALLDVTATLNRRVSELSKQIEALRLEHERHLVS